MLNRTTSVHQISNKNKSRLTRVVGSKAAVGSDFFLTCPPAGDRPGFAAALTPRLFGNSIPGHTTRSPTACKHWHAGKVRTGDRRHPVLCLCLLRQDIPAWCSQHLFRETQDDYESQLASTQHPQNRTWVFFLKRYSFHSVFSVIVGWILAVASDGCPDVGLVCTELRVTPPVKSTRAFFMHILVQNGADFWCRCVVLGLVVELKTVQLCILILKFKLSFLLPTMSNLLDLVKNGKPTGAVDDGPLVMSHTVPEARLREHDVVRLIKIYWFLSFRLLIYWIFK